MPGAKCHRADVIEEDEGADHVPARERQHAPDFEAAEIAAALVDDIHADDAFTRRDSATQGNAAACRWQTGPAPESHCQLARATSGTRPGRSSPRRSGQREMRVVVIDHRRQRRETAIVIEAAVGVRPQAAQRRGAIAPVR